jgi:Uma2 family endonuclease
MNNEVLLSENYEPVPLRQPFHLVHNYTYADYEAWNDGVRRELIDGEAYEMASPTGRHQTISMVLSVIFGNYLRGKTCQAFAGPYDVRLFAPIDAEVDKKDDRYTVVPDLCVICDRKKLHRDGCHGAPDLIIEIISPSTEDHDTELKFDAYLKAGVREYWIINPYKRSLTVYQLMKDSAGTAYYKAEVYGPTDNVKVGVLDGLSVDMAEILCFDERGLPLPDPVSNSNFD